MLIGQALDLVSRYDSLRNPLTSLGDYLDPELISRCLAESGTVTLRKRRLPLEMMVWCIVGMALERKEPLHQIVNRLDIMLPGNRPFVAPSAVIQARQRLGSEAVRRVFTKTAQLWHNATLHPHWCGLTLLAIDGVFWRTPDTPENDAAFPRQTHAENPALYPQVKMVCQMELTSHLLTSMTDAMRFTGTYTGADARSCKYGTTSEITDKKGKGLPESGKGEALEIPHSPEKEPVSCLTDWHYSLELPFFILLVVKLKRFSHYRSHQIWLALRYSSSKKTPLPAISHKKDSLTKSDKIMRFPSHILTSGTVC